MPTLDEVLFGSAAPPTARDQVPPAPKTTTLDDVLFGTGPKRQEADVRQFATELGVDPHLAAAVAGQESNFNPKAVSRRGAQGTMQVMPGTSTSLAPTYGNDLRRQGVGYLGERLADFADLPDAERQSFALAAYNAGPGRVAQARRKATAKGLDASVFANVARFLPAETRDYVPSVLARMPAQPKGTTLDDVLFGSAPQEVPPRGTPGSPTDLGLITGPGAATGGLVGGALEGMPPMVTPGTGVAAAAARVIPPIAVGVTGYGLPLTGVAGGAGEGLAQMIEKAGGAREQYAPLAIPLQAALSALPVGKFVGAGPVARTLGRAGQGAALGGVGTAGTELAEGRRPTLDDVLFGAGVGGVLGGAGGALESRRLGRAPAPQVEAPPVGTPGTPVGIGDVAGEPSGSAFTRLPGVAGEIPPALPRPDEKLARQVERVDELYGSLPQPNRELLQGVMVDNADVLEEAARGQQPIARTIALADELVIDPDELRRTMRDRGGAAPEVQQAALDQHVAFFTNRTYEAVMAAKANPADVGLKLAVKKAYTDLVSLVAGATGNAADAARVLRIRREMAKAYSPVGGVDPRVVKKALRMGVDEERLVDLLSKMDPTDTLGQYRMLQNLRNPGARGLWQWYWYNSLLSRPRTHGRNITGNILNLATKIALRPVAGGIDAAVSTVTGAPRETYASELPQALLGIKKAFPEAVDKFLFAMKHGFSLDDTHTLELRPPEVSILGHRALPNVIGRSLQAVDQFFKHLAFTSEMHSIAYRDAVRKVGRDPQQIAAYMTDLLAEPPPKMVKEARDFAKRAAFQEDLPKFMNSWIRGTAQLRDPDAGKLGQAMGVTADVVAPFLRTPFNLLRQGLHLTPVGAAMPTTFGGGRVGRQAQAELAIGSLLLAPIAWAAGEGYLTGSGPQGPQGAAARDALYKAGWKPNSIRIPQADGRDRYVQIPMPVALPFVMVANAVEAYRDGRGGVPDPTVILAKTANSVLQQSFVTNASALLEALQTAAAGEGSPLTRFASQTIKSLVPFSGAVQTARELQDIRNESDYVREARTPAEAVGAAFPTQMRDALGLPDAPPRIRATGEPARKGLGFFETLTGLGVSQAPDRPPLDRELARLDDAGLLEPLSLPSRKLSVAGKKQVLSRTDEYTLRQARGIAVREALEHRMASSGYQAAKDEQRAALVRRTVTQTRDQITKRASSLYRQHGQLRLEDILPERLQP